METDHVTRLRKNLNYLKDHLDVEHVLDCLHQEGIFSMGEVHECQTAKTPENKSKALVGLLMRKGPDDYTVFRIIVQENQRFITERLDKTDSQGTMSVINQHIHSLEKKHKHELKAKDERIAELMKISNDQKEAHKSNIEAVEKQRDELEKTVVERDGHLEEQRQRHREEIQLETERLEQETEKHKAELVQETEKHKAELEQETERHRAELEQETEKHTQEHNREKQLAEEAERKYQDDVIPLRQKNEELTKMVERLEELNQTLTLNVDQTGVKDEGEQLSVGAEEKPTMMDGCVLSTSSECDSSQLILLPCLHAVCHRCLTHHNSEDMTCVCGRSIQLKEGPRDFVRINEQAFDNILGHGQICTNCESNQAISYCTDCTDYYCDECQQLHDGIKKNQKHSVHPLDSSPMSIEKWLKEPPCKDHPDHPADLYDMECKRAICTVCAHENHRHGSNTSLKKVADEAKTTLTELIEPETTKLDAIKDQVVNVARHGEELRKVATDLGRTVIELRNDLVTMILHRQKHLQEQISQSIDAPMITIREKMNMLKLAEASVTSTIDYIHRTLKSTTQAELVAVTDVIQRKSAEDQEIELPPKDTRDTRIRVSIQGQRALQELIDTVGCLYTSLADEERGDTQPTVADLCRDNHCLKEELQTRSLAANVAQQETETKLQRLHQALGETGVQRLELALADADNVQVMLVQPQIITYPHMTFNKERTNTDVCQINDDGILVNKPARQTRHRQRLRRYPGTCGSSLLPLPTSPSTVPPAAQYWEVHVRVEGRGWCNLELGVRGEESLDRKEELVRRDSHSWVMAANYCKKHNTYCVAPFMAGERGECCLSLPPGPVTTFHYGVVVDVGRGRVGMLDTNNGKVLMKCSAKFNQILIPVFGVYSEYSSIKMTLVSGADIAWTPQKKSLIQNILN